MKVTIQDIANMVGVSKSTVSRYLNGGYVSEDNKEKIKVAIEKTGFQSNFFAKRLKAKKSKLVGIIIPRIDSFTAGKTLKGIDKKLQENGYQGIILTSDLNKEKELKDIRNLYDQGVDGIIIMSFEISREHINLINSANIPVVFSGQESEFVNYVSIDDYKIGKTLGDYVRDKGHKKIVFLGVSEKDKAVGFKRKKGFFDSFKNNQEINFVQTDFSFEGAYSAANEVVKYKPTVVVCATDNIALGFMRFLLEKGIKVPEDISIAGFGDYDVSSITYPSLTTVKIDYNVFGEKTAEKLLNLINEKDIDIKYEIPSELVIRESVKNIKD